MKMETSQMVEDLILKTQPWGLVLLQGLVARGGTGGSQLQADLDLQVLRDLGDLSEETSPTLKEINVPFQNISLNNLLMTF